MFFIFDVVDIYYENKVLFGFVKVVNVGGVVVLVFEMV